MLTLSADSSNLKQRDMAVRYVKKFYPSRKTTRIYKMREYWMKCNCTTNNRCISKIWFRSTDLLVSDLRWSRKLTSKQKGASNQFKELTGNQKAVYCHCATFEPNWVYVKQPGSQRYTIWYALCSHLFYFSSFQLIVKDSLKTRNLKKNRKKPLCEARWVEKHNAFNNLSKFYEIAIYCIENIESNHDA